MVNQAHPGDDQTRERVREWMKENAKPGLIVVIRSTMQNWHFGGRYEYLLDEIVEVAPRKGRFYTHTAASHKAYGRGTYYFSGQSATDPRGQVDALIPTPELVEAAFASKAQSGIGRSHHWTLVSRAIQQTEELFGIRLEEPETPEEANRRKVLAEIESALKDSGFEPEEGVPGGAMLYRTAQGDLAAVVQTSEDDWRVFLPISMTWRDWEALRRELRRYLAPPPPLNIRRPPRLNRPKGDGEAP